MILEHDSLIIELREWRLKLEKQIWNKAIETALKVALVERNNIEMEQEIRKLKK